MNVNPDRCDPSRPDEAAMAKANDSYINVGKGATSFIGPDATRLYAAAQLQGFLKLFAKTGIVPTRGINGTRLLALATGYTGKGYKRGQHMQAYEDMCLWVDTMKAALPVLKDGQQV